MNRFGLGESNAPHPLVDHDYRRPAALTLAYLHWWDKGLRVPADIAARLMVNRSHSPTKQPHRR